MTSSTITRVDAFNTLGTSLLSTTSAVDVLAAGGLAGWNIRKAPAYAVDPITGDRVEMPDRRAVLFDRPEGGLGYLGDVGRAHTTIQNEDQIAIMDLFATEAGATFETAGIAKGGRRTFITMKLPGHYRVGGVDLIDNYVAGINSHDGAANILMVTPVRFGCMNMLNVALGNNSCVIKTRHTRHAVARLREEVLGLLDKTFIYLDEFNQTAEKMADTTLTQARFEEILVAEFGASADAAKSAQTRAESKIEDILDLFSVSNTNSGIRETVWAGFNALTEWAEHYAPVRNDDEDLARAERSIFDPSTKDRAMALMLQEVAA